MQQVSSSLLELQQLSATSIHLRRLAAELGVLFYGADTTGVEERRTLEIIPEQVIVHVDIYHNYACRDCEKESDQANIVKTPKAPAVIPGSFASAKAIAYLDVQKYVMGVPLYRQEQH